MKNAPNAEHTRTRTRTRTWRGALAGAVLVSGGMAFTPAAHAASLAGSVDEGDTMEFTVELGVAPNGWAVRYKYKTKDDSAVEGDDYESTTGTVTFASGVKEKKVSVDTIDDNDVEGSEAFKLVLYDQEVKGLIRGVTGWTTTTLIIQGMPKTFTLTGQIRDNDSATTDAKSGS